MSETVRQQKHQVAEGLVMQKKQLIKSQVLTVNSFIETLLQGFL